MTDILITAAIFAIVSVIVAYIIVRRMDKEADKKK